jgi:hypothetical protein
MIKILNYAVCQITHRVYEKFSYEIKGKEGISENWFENEEEALLHQIDCRRSLLLGKFCEWIQHKNHIDEHSDYYKTNSQRAEALHRLNEAAKLLHEYSLPAIADMILQSKSLLESALPSANNVSHQSAIDYLNEIISTAEYEKEYFKKSLVA